MCCDQQLYVCLSVRLHISKTTCPNFTKFSVHISCGHDDSVLLWRQCNHVGHLRFCWWHHVFFTHQRGKYRRRLLANYSLRLAGWRLADGLVFMTRLCVYTNAGWLARYQTRRSSLSRFTVMPAVRWIQSTSAASGSASSQCEVAIRPRTG